MGSEVPQGEAEVHARVQMSRSGNVWDNAAMEELLLLA